MSGATGAPRHWLPVFLLLGSVWGTSFLFLQIAVPTMGPIPTAWVRVTLAALCLMPLVLWRGHGRAMVGLYKPMIFMGLLNSGIPFLCYSYALQHITTGMASVLNATTPLFTALIAWAWLGERPNLARVLGLLLGLSGIALLMRHSPGGLSGGHGWALLACLTATSCYGVASNFNQRHLREVPPLVSAAGSQAGASLGLLLPAYWTWPSEPPSINAWLALATLAVFCTALAYLWFFWLMARIGAARTSTVIFLVPVVATTLGVVVLDEPVSAWMLGCAALILLGTALSSGLLGARLTPASALPEHAGDAQAGSAPPRC